MLILHMPRSTHLHLVSSPSPMTLGAAIAKAMHESIYRVEDDLAPLLGVSQSTVSRMITGHSPVTVERVRQIEDLCGLPRGEILRWAGYVDGTVLPEVLIAADEGNKRTTAPEKSRPQPRAKS
jgi:DNA-binding transcriptional regulator YdaS (Cro superfamily)